MYRQEHPKPQFMRSEWKNLNGDWDFEFDFGRSGTEREIYKLNEFSKKIQVPFCPESKLSGIEYKDFMNAVWYMKHFDISKQWKTTGRVFLHFGAVDYFCNVYINDVKAGSHEGGYTSFKIDITDYINAGKNKVTVYVEDDNRQGKQPRGKQSSKFYSIRCDYTRTTGIWQTVFLEHVPCSYVDRIEFYPDAENCKVAFKAETVGSGTLNISTYYEGRDTGAISINSRGGTVHGEISLSEKQLWEVGKGRLYNVEIQYGDDLVTSYFGLRTVKMDGKRFLLNSETVFQRLVLDQGFYMDGIYTAPTEECFVRDIELSLAAGFNGARLHEKVFEERFLYHCDRMGYLVWGEFPDWGLDYSNPFNLAPYISQWLEVLKRDFNHPSIIGWCPFNETWDYEGRKQWDYLISTIYHVTKTVDSTRPCIDTSGNYHTVTDIFDVHDYEQNPAEFAKHYEGLTEHELIDQASERQSYTGGPFFVSEYGGICWDVSNMNGWGYGDTPKTENEFINRYKGLTDVLLDNENMFGFCYTQLYDVEQEVNGLYTYDRKPKFNMEIFKQINSRRAKIEE